MQPNWHKGPHDATHFAPAGKAGQFEYQDDWFKITNSSVVYRRHGGNWALAPGIDVARTLQLIPRPALWHEGCHLPPVGTVCEVNGAVGQELRKQEFSWVKCEIVSHANFCGVPIAIGVNAEMATLGWGMAIKFRRILTDEELAQAERKKGVQTIMDAAGVTGSAFADDPEARVWAEALYDANFRQQVTQ